MLDQIQDGGRHGHRKQEEIIVDQWRPNDIELTNGFEFVVRKGLRLLHEQSVDGVPAPLKLSALEHAGDDRKPRSTQLLETEIM